MAAFVPGWRAAWTRRLETGEPADHDVLLPLVARTRDDCVRDEKLDVDAILAVLSSPALVDHPHAVPRAFNFAACLMNPAAVHGLRMQAADGTSEEVEKEADNKRTDNNVERRLLEGNTVETVLALMQELDSIAAIADEGAWLLAHLYLGWHSTDAKTTFWNFALRAEVLEKLCDELHCRAQTWDDEAYDCDTLCDALHIICQGGTGDNSSSKAVAVVVEAFVYMLPDEVVVVAPPPKEEGVEEGGVHSVLPLCLRPCYPLRSSKYARERATVCARQMGKKARQYLPKLLGEKFLNLEHGVAAADAAIEAQTSKLKACKKANRQTRR